MKENLSCSKCGASMTIEALDQEHIIARCQYCGNTAVMDSVSEHNVSDLPADDIHAAGIGRKGITFAAVALVTAVILVSFFIFVTGGGKPRAGITAQPPVRAVATDIPEKRVRTPFSAGQLKNRTCEEVISIMKDAGFINIKIAGAEENNGTLSKNIATKKVSRISINGDWEFERYIYYSNHSDVYITVR